MANTSQLSRFFQAKDRIEVCNRPNGTEFMQILLNYIASIVLNERADGLGGKLPVNAPRPLRGIFEWLTAMRGPIIPV